MKVGGSADATSAGLGLGKLIEPDAVHERDAVHIAVIPVVAGQPLAPGAQVYLKEGRAFEEPHHPDNTIVGVVDPFLGPTGPGEGQRFWLFLFPGTITSLRHEWSHPAFPSPAAQASREWLEHFIGGHRVRSTRDDSAWGELATVDEIVRSVAEDCSVNTYGEDNADEARQRSNELVWHVETVLGRRLPPGHAEGVYFSCSC